MIYLLVVYAYPLLWLLMKSFSGPSGLTLQPYVAFMSDPFNWRVIGNTLRVAAWVTVVCFIIGYPAAFALARAGAFVQIVMLVSIILPLSIGAVVKAFAWQIVLRRDGVVTQLMMGLGIWDEPQRLLFTETGLVLGAANIFLPFMILPIYSVVKLIDPRLSEAGATLGATPLYRFTHVTLPLTLPGVVSGIAFVFSLSVSMYVIPSLLIGDRFQTLSTLTGRSFLLMRNEHSARPRPSSCWCWPSPSSSARPGLPAGSGAAHDGPLMTGIEKLTKYVTWFIAAFTVVFLMTPLVVTIAVSFGSSTVFTLPPPDWSLRWYERLANTRGLLPALVTSLQVAAISTAVALALGTLCAIALVRGRFPGREAISPSWYRR